jgi:hypothetical protein
MAQSINRFVLSPIEFGVDPEAIATAVSEVIEGKPMRQSHQPMALL